MKHDSILNFCIQQLCTLVGLSFFWLVDQGWFCWLVPILVGSQVWSNKRGKWVERGWVVGLGGWVWGHIEQQLDSYRWLLMIGNGFTGKQRQKQKT